MESKARLRKQLKAVRNSLDPKERGRFSAQIAERLAEQAWYKTADAILVYSAIQSEADLKDFCLQARKDQKTLFFPKVFGENMDFFRIDERNQLCPGAFGVMEPDVDHFTLQPYRSDGGRVPVLVPGLVFSRKGERIGYGKGYYDRYVSGHPELLPVGVCFECQLISEIPTEPQDIVMRQIATELRLYETGNDNA